MAAPCQSLGPALLQAWQILHDYYTEVHIRWAVPFHPEAPTMIRADFASPQASERLPTAERRVRSSSFAVEEECR
jgi:hypothetical protein